MHSNSLELARQVAGRQVESFNQGVEQARQAKYQRVAQGLLELRIFPQRDVLVNGVVERKFLLEVPLFPSGSQEACFFMPDGSICWLPFGEDRTGKYFDYDGRRIISGRDKLRPITMFVEKAYHQVVLLAKKRQLCPSYLGPDLEQDLNS